jgi:hypothetical protein
LLKWLIEEGRERVPAMPDTTREIRLQAAADAPLDDLRADVNALRAPPPTRIALRK